MMNDRWAINHHKETLILLILVPQQIPARVLIEEIVENKQDYQCHPECDDQVTRTDEHDGKEEEWPEDNILQESLLCRCDGEHHEATAEVEEDIGNPQNIRIHIDIVDRHEQGVGHGCCRGSRG